MNPIAPTGLACAIGLVFAVPAMAGTLEQHDFMASAQVIEADYAVAKAGCASLQSDTGLCMTVAKGLHDITLVELAALHEPGMKARYDVRIARAHTRYAISRERCGDNVGDTRDACVRQAEVANSVARASATAHLMAGECAR